MQHSEETKRKIREARKKQIILLFSEEHKKKISEALRGRIFTEQTRKKMSEVNRGENNPNYGKNTSVETRKKLSESNRGKHNHDGKNNPNYGKHHSEESRRKISESHIGKSCGEKSHFWKGGISFEPYCPKFNKEFKERVRAFFGFQCVECGTPQNGMKLHVHHVNFNKKSCCDSSVPLFVSLCQLCHLKTNFNRDHWEQHFTEIINNYYEGKCYLTQEEMMKIRCS